jgi:hypothetical protein
MTERKPLGMNFESWIDKQVREATERGEFDNLRGSGKPIPGSGAIDDENWWLTNYLRREGVRADGMLPPSLVLRRDVEQLPETARELDTERQVRDAVAELNRRIVEWLRLPHGPHVPVSPVDAEDIVSRWRSERASARQNKPNKPNKPTGSPRTDAEHSDTQPNWWRRFIRLESRAQ